MMDVKLIFTGFLIFIIKVQGQFDPIAFTLGQDSNVDIQNGANDTKIPFTVVITNHRQANLNSGVFTCTEEGMYKFQVYSLTWSNTNLFLELYVNSKLVASLQGHTPGDYAAAGNAVILPLKSGDAVKVMSRSQYASNIFGTPDQIYTTFTGVQLGSLELGAEFSTTLSAFSVSLTQQQDVPGGKPVLYNNVLVDVNGAYNVTTGVYTVPSSGLYIFHFFSLALRNKDVWQELYHNNQYVCSIYERTDQDSAGAGNTVLLHLKRKDQISIRAHQNHSLYGATNQIYSTFTGAQLVTDADMRSGQEPVIAFSVGLSHHATVADHYKVIFDRVFIDLQHAYDQKTGEFIVPVSGLYEFSYHALGKRNGTIWLELFHNYRYVNSLYSHTPGHFATGGNAAVLELDAGDVIYVNARGNVDLFGVFNRIYCTFTGYLLNAVDNIEIIGKK
ncbi:uncharacterized protein LOC123528253 [Mercenaria mercenaria]|uniref:uncharacterized protein LOC123528253 n=1 Tax=Mercenaria mercenaria TaxID=6596 RepID=UPI00234EA75F|nr:uncharacterized protein LOC123528253 [Mercenaria mercenaria]XP_045163919.2 uncharacterized protein LOC123528253 [Mercenaria mercenaria]